MFRTREVSAFIAQVGGQAVLGRQSLVSTPWLTERHGYDPTCDFIRNPLPSALVDQSLFDHLALAGHFRFLPLDLRYV